MGIVDEFLNGFVVSVVFYLWGSAASVMISK